jgi:uncharacterized protein
MKKRFFRNDPSRIGQNLFLGSYGKRSYRRAFPYLLEAAKLGEIHSQNLVGYCYSKGLGVKKEISKAMYWYHRAAKHNK